MTSIRSFLITLLLATIILAIFLSVLKGYQASHTEIQQQMDKRLIDMAELLSNLHHAKQVVPNAAHVGDNFAFQIFSTDKNLLDRSSTAINTPQITVLKQGFNEVNFNNYRWRSYAFFNPQRQLWTIVAERLDIRFGLAERILLKSLMPIILGIPIAALLIWLIIGHALTPLHSLSDVLKNKREHDLSPLKVKQPYKEVEQVIQSTNSLLKRLGLSFEREKRFASNVAHELRTPLSVLKMDVFNLSRDLAEDSHNVLRLNQGIDRMEHLVQQILTLHRTTSEQFVAHFAEVNLSVLAQNLIAEYYENFDKKCQSIELQAKPCQLQADQATLKILLLNLIENASKYTPEQGSIKVSLLEKSHTVILHVEDSGIGIDPSQYERVFERFYRVDGDCHASKQVGCGIGLSIVKHIADLHNAEIQLHASTFSTGLKVTVIFPKGEDHV